MSALPLNTDDTAPPHNLSARSSFTGAAAIIFIYLMLSLPAGADNLPGAPASELFDTRGWMTDFSKHSVPFEEIISGGPPKDGIPAIDKPKFITVLEADDWLNDREPVVIFEYSGVARAYPLQIIIWHEIVNDQIADLPISITYCPLCNTAIAFDRRLENKILDFGTTGKLRHSDLVMYDRQTESWWQQAIGKAIVGQLTGRQLKLLPAPTVSWKDFRNEHPEGQVLSRDTGFQRQYGKNPYHGYDTGHPFLFKGSRDDRLPMMERVVVVTGENLKMAVAFPFRTLAKERVVNHQVNGNPIAIFFRMGTASALDAEKIAESRDVGSAIAYKSSINGKTLHFKPAGASFQDEETGTTWSFLGRAEKGPLQGQQLEPTVHFIPFWFAWATFRPETPVYGQLSGDS